jgi:CRP/FNR family transcriptional regulator
MNKLWFLRRLDLFEGLSEPEMERIGTLMQMRTCRPGQEVAMRPSGDRIYLMKAGRVRVLQGELVAAVLGPGQLFGTSSLFGAASADQRVVAIEDIVFCEAPAAQFLAAMTVHPRLAAKVAMVLARQLFELEQTVERSATDPVSSRLAELLLRVARSDGAVPQVRGMSQADLARMIGSSRESVSRLIADWERDGTVRSRPRLIELTDESALRRLAG